MPISAAAALFTGDRTELVTVREDDIYCWRLERGRSSEAPWLRIGPPRRLGSLTSLETGGLGADGRTLALVHQSHVHLLDLAGERAPPVFSDFTGLFTLVVDPAGRCLVVCDGPAYQFWQPGSCRKGPRLERHRVQDPPGRMAFTSDGRILAVARTLTVAEIVDTETVTPVLVFGTPRRAILWEMAFSPGGRCFAASTIDASPHLWDLEELRRELPRLGLDSARPAPPPLLPQRRGRSGGERGSLSHHLHEPHARRLAQLPRHR